jgi:hypothetical protein
VGADPVIFIVEGGFNVLATEENIADAERRAKLPDAPRMPDGRPHASVHRSAGHPKILSMIATLRQRVIQADLMGWDDSRGHAPRHALFMTNKGLSHPKESFP